MNHHFRSLALVLIAFALSFTSAHAAEPQASPTQTAVEPVQKEKPPAETKKNKKRSMKRVRVEKKRAQQTEDKIPPKQQKAMESSKKGDTSPSYDPDHAPLLN